MCSLKSKNNCPVSENQAPGKASALVMPVKIARKNYCKCGAISCNAYFTDTQPSSESNCEEQIMRTTWAIIFGKYVKRH